MLRLITSATGSRFGDVPSNVALYLGGIVATMGVATLAYKFYELPFLRLKSRFAVVKSGAG